MKEEWRPINHYKSYMVSNTGKVKSLDRKTTYSNGVIVNYKERISKQWVGTTGYYTVCLYKNNKPKHVKVHRLIAASFIPNPNNYAEVNHKDLNKLNNSISNLEWCTRKQNVTHAVLNGAFSHKISPQEVVEIRNKYRPHIYSVSDLIKEYGYSRSAIRSILAHKSWTHIKTSKPKRIEPGLKEAENMCRYRRVIRMDQQLNEIDGWLSITFAAKEINKNVSNIIEACRTGWNSGGYKWKYA